MSMMYVVYFTPTKEEAVRIGLMAKRIHGKPLDRCVAISPVDDPRKIFREPQYGKPRIECHWGLSTRNPELAADKEAWETAIRLYETKPYWLAYLLSWIERWRRK